MIWIESRRLIVELQRISICQHAVFFYFTSRGNNFNMKNNKYTEEKKEACLERKRRRKKEVERNGSWMSWDLSI